MDERTRGRTIPRWVDTSSGVVEREVFVSDEVYRLELERIFERSWVYLAHETEIPAAGDFVARVLGKAPVIVIRDGDNRIHAILNSCRHRGAKLCRADSGSVRRFVCPYHGWSYERDGRLITTTFDGFLPEGMDFAEWGLVRVPRVENYKGLIFGCWDAAAPSLHDYLGDFRWHLDAFVARTPGGMQVLAPPHRWRARCNWKVGALNFIGDGQHILTTHIGPITLDAVRSARVSKPADRSVQVITDEGHGVTLTYLPEGLPEESYRTHPGDLVPLYEAQLGPGQSDILKHIRVGVGTVFPNLSFIETQIGPEEKSVILRLWHPVSGSEMEVLSWVLAEREAPSDYKERMLRKGVHNFGVAGVFEQDDLELWEAATAASSNTIAQRYPYSFHTALPYLDKPVSDYPGPGRAYRPSIAEVIQLEFMRHWEKVMNGVT